MGLFANVPYAQAPGMAPMPLHPPCFDWSFTWQETLAMVFLCGLINILITVTKVRKMIIKAIPEPLQQAIGGGIGLFVAYVGLLNVNFITFTPKDTKAAGQGLATGATPGMATLNSPVLWLFLIGLLLAIVFTILKVKGGLLLTIIITAVIGIPMGLTTMSNSVSLGETFSQLPQTFGALFTGEGFGSLFSDPAKLPLVLVTIFAFSMSDTFDTLGTFIGTGRRTGIFSKADEESLENGHGFSSKMDKALFADSIATSIGSICGTSNTTTYVESSAGIAAGGRTGLTSVIVAACFAVSAFFAPVISAVPSAATAGVLVIVGCLMAASLKEVKWDDITEGNPGVLRRRVHGVLLLDLLRHRWRLHHLLHRQGVQERRPTRCIRSCGSSPRCSFSTSSAWPCSDGRSGIASNKAPAIRGLIVCCEPLAARQSAELSAYLVCLRVSGWVRQTKS